jgi:hypothetical protein
VAQVIDGVVFPGAELVESLLPHPTSRMIIEKDVAKAILKIEDFSFTMNILLFGVWLIVGLGTSVRMGMEPVASKTALGSQEGSFSKSKEQGNLILALPSNSSIISLRKGGRQNCGDTKN